ncbi:transcriptional repressor LexA [Chlamydiota bacterium]
MASLTYRQNQIVEFIKDFHMHYSRPPTYREIAQKFRFKSVNAVTDHLKALEQKGYIRRHKNISRGIELTFNYASSKIPLLGRITAGTPLLSEENSEGSISLTDFKNVDFALRIQGMSMKNAGILDGDTVFIKAQKEALHKDIIVARLPNGETTVKRLLKTNGTIILHPEHEEMDDIVLTEDIEIIGKVVGVVRKI